MVRSDLERRILSERLCALANLCQTLAVGILLLGIVAPLLQPADVSSRPVDAAIAGVAALLLLISGHKLLGEAVRVDP
jgi:hypothetical protein